MTVLLTTFAESLLVLIGGIVAFLVLLCYGL